MKFEFSMGRDLRAAVGSAVLVVAALLAAHSPRAMAADNSEFGLIGGFLPGPTGDSEMTLIAPRDADAIRMDLQGMRNLSSAAERAVRRANSLVIQVRAEVEQREAEIDALKEEEKRAKEENREADRDALELRRKSKEMILDLYKAYKDVREGEKVLAEARRDLADARVHFHEKELELSTRRATLREAMATPGADPGKARDSEARAEAVTLSLLKEVADDESAVAKDQQALVERISKVRELRLDIQKASAR